MVAAFGGGDETDVVLDETCLVEDGDFELSGVCDSESLQQIVRTFGSEGRDETDEGENEEEEHCPSCSVALLPHCLTRRELVRIGFAEVVTWI